MFVFIYFLINQIDGFNWFFFGPLVSVVQYFLGQKMMQFIIWY